VFSLSGLIIRPIRARVAFRDASHDKVQQLVAGIKLFPHTGLSERARHYSKFRDCVDFAD